MDAAGPATTVQAVPEPVTTPDVSSSSLQSVVSPIEQVAASAVPRVITCYWYQEGHNFGDWLSPHILNRVLAQHVPEATGDGNKWVIRFRDTGGANPSSWPDIVGIGSIIDRIPASYTGWIWTTGNAREEFATPISRQARIAGWRGKYTRQKGPWPHAPLGDGGLLAHLLLPESKLPEPYVETLSASVAQPPLPAFKPIAVVPHVVDWPTVQTWYREWLKTQPADVRLRLINLRQPPEQVVQQMSECSAILSSSLHGLVAADALHLPSARFHVSTSRQIIGGAYKFRDYYSAFGPEYESRCESHVLTPSTTWQEIQQWPRPAPANVADVQASVLQHTVDMLQSIIADKKDRPDSFAAAGDSPSSPAAAAAVPRPVVAQATPVSAPVAVPRRNVPSKATAVSRPSQSRHPRRVVHRSRRAPP